jgi:hypothetical protein
MSDDNIISLDGKGGDSLRETLIVERQFDRILKSTSTNLLDYNNRASLKSGVLGLEAYLADILCDDKTYQEKSKIIKDGNRGSTQEEVDKCFRLLSEIKKAVSRSKLAAPDIMNYDASDDEE